jgi:hypothetical protein
VLVATTLLTIGLIAIATGFQHATSGVVMGRGETTAVFLVEQRLEQLKARALASFTDGALDEGTTTEYCLSSLIAAGTTNCQAGDVPGPSYTRTTVITDVTAGAGCPAAPVSCKQLQVRVTYRPLAGTGDLSTPRAVDVVTMLAPRT